MHSNGSVVKFKARRIAKEYRQLFGIDYDQTFSPVVKYESIRMVPAIATQQHMPII